MISRESNPAGKQALALCEIVSQNVVQAADTVLQYGMKFPHGETVSVKLLLNHDTVDVTYSSGLASRTEHFGSKALSNLRKIWGSPTFRISKLPLAVAGCEGRLSVLVVQDGQTRSICDGSELMHRIANVHAYVQGVMSLKAKE